MSPSYSIVFSRSSYLRFFSHSFSFILCSAGTAKSTILQVLFVLLIIIRSGLLAEITWSVCMATSHRSLWVLFSRTGVGLCIYHLFVWSNLNFLYIYQWITLPGCPRGVMVKAMNCGIVVREFVLQSRYYVHFRANTLGKGMNPLILPPAMGK